MFFYFSFISFSLHFLFFFQFAFSLFTGIGWGMVFISALVSIYYNVIIGWSIYYLFVSFTAKLPWNDCLNNFNDVRCRQLNVNVSNQTNVPGNNRHNRKFEEIYDKRIRIPSNQ